jgi:hypothetical protein
LPISGSSYYDENKENGGKKKPFFRAYLDALKAGKRALDAAAYDTSTPAVSPPLQVPPVPIAPPVTYAASPVEPQAIAAPPVAAAPPEAIIAAAPAAPRAARRPAKRRRSTSDSTEMTVATSASMDVMMQHILELAQKVEAAASKVEAVADKADASARPAAEDGVMVTTRTNFSRPAPQPFGAHTGAAHAAEASAVPPVISDPVMRPSMPMAQPSPRNSETEAYGRDATASGLVSLDEMSIPKVAPFILDEAKAAPTQPIPELRKVDSAIPDLHLTKTQDEPRPQGAPIVLRPQKKDSRAVNEGR